MMQLLFGLLVLLPSFAMAFGGVTGLFDRSVWSDPKRRSLLPVMLVAVVTTGVGAYALFFDWRWAQLTLELFAVQIVLTWLGLFLSFRKDPEARAAIGEARKNLAGRYSLSAFRAKKQTNARELLKEDARPPILYLRSFAREFRTSAARQQLLRVREKFGIMGRLAGSVLQSKNDPEAIERQLADALSRRGVFGPLTAQNLVESVKAGRGAMYDEQLIVANVMSKVGPYIAIARPSERRGWRDVGAAKLEVSDEDWQEVVGDLLRRSAAVVVEAGNSSGLLWEMEQIVLLRQPRKILFLLPLSEKEYDNFVELTRDIFPLPLPRKKPLSRMMTFHGDWSPRILGEAGADIDKMYLQESVDENLRPFLAQNGLQLEHPPRQ